MDKMILYRSRTEIEIDNLIWNGSGAFLEVFVALGIWVAVFWLLHNVYRKYPNTRRFVSKHSLDTIIFVVSLPISYVLYKLFFKLLMVL